MIRDQHTVALLAYDGLAPFEFGIMVELFGLPRPEFDVWYRLCVAGLEKRPLRAMGGLLIEVPYSLNILDRAGTIIIPGWCGVDTPVPAKLTRKLRRAHAEGARILSVCTGAFVLAAAGLLDGKRAATHWKYTDQLARKYPQIRVDPNVLYVDEGNLITSAGSAAGIDMGLHLIRRDFGANIANIVARRMVVAPQRDGGQQQFIKAPVAIRSEEQGFANILDDIRADIREEHTVESMSAAAAMSSRTFARRFKQVIGTTPHRWLQLERVRVAQSLLETTDYSVEQVADRSGFSDAHLLRLHFKRVVGTSPAKYRRVFSAGDLPYSIPSN